MQPLQETGKRPTAALDRNLSYLGLVEILFGYPLDGVVLTTGCDKTTPACIMAAATVNLPAIVLSGGPMLNGWWKGERAGGSARRVVAGLRGDSGALSRARTDRLRDRLARGRDGARRPEAFRYSHPRGVREHDRGEFRDRRLDQRADPHQRDRSPYRRAALGRGLAADRSQDSALGQHAAGRKISRR